MAQNSYEDKPGRGYAGQIAKPNAPYDASAGWAQVGSGERKPRPGDAVIWDATNNRFKCPANTDDGRRDTVGIVVFSTTAIARGADTQVVEYNHGNAMTVLRYGYIYVRVNSTTAIEYGTRMKWNQGASITDESDWEPWIGTDATPSGTVAQTQDYLSILPITLAEPNGVAANTDSIVAVKIG